MKKELLEIRESLVAFRNDIKKLRNDLWSYNMALERMHNKKDIEELDELGGEMIETGRRFKKMAKDLKESNK